MTPRTPRPRLLLFTCRDEFAQRSAIAATLAWMAEASGFVFDVYYDAMRAGKHYGGGATSEPGLRHGGLMVGGRHLETLVTALSRFETTVLCAGRTAFANTLATFAADGLVSVELCAERLECVYESAIRLTGLSW